MNLTITDIQQQYNSDRKQQLVLTISGTADISKYQQMIAKGQELQIEIKRKKRSLDANSFCWLLVGKIAAAIQQTPENVYREFIHRVGQYTFVLVPNKDLEDIIRGWTSRGIGWLAETAWESKKVPDCTTLKVYRGSSDYNSKEMSILIDEIVNECKELEIPTESPAEIERLKAEWGK